VPPPTPIWRSFKRSTCRGRRDDSLYQAVGGRRIFERARRFLLDCNWLPGLASSIVSRMVNRRLRPLRAPTIAVLGLSVLPRRLEVRPFPTTRFCSGLSRLQLCLPGTFDAIEASRSLGFRSSLRRRKGRGTVLFLPIVREPDSTRPFPESQQDGPPFRFFFALDASTYPVAVARCLASSTVSVF